MSKSSGTVLVLGANGALGRYAVRAFAGAGWQVRAQTRTNATPAYAEISANDSDQKRLSRFVSHAPIDLEDQPSLRQAAEGCDVIVNALNPLYSKWQSEVPKITRATLDAAKSSGATIILPGNVYNFGADMPCVLNADIKHSASNPLGQIRIEMEQAYQTEAKKGQQTIVLRMGDFLSPELSGNWFDQYMTTKIGRGRLVYPGPANLAHAWAYLPDAGRAMVELADRRDQFGNYTDIPFPGTTLTGDQLADHIATALDRPISISKLPWWVLHLIALFNPVMRGVLEMRYLWNTPHALDGSSFSKALPDFQFTPTPEIIAKCVERFR